MLLALFAFPWLHKRVPLLSVYRGTSILFVLIYPLFSLLPKLARSTSEESFEWGPILWVVLLILMVTRYAVLAVALTSLQIVVSLKFLQLNCITIIRFTDSNPVNITVQQYREASGAPPI